MNITAAAQGLIFTLRAQLVIPLEKERKPSQSAQLHSRLYFTGRKERVGREER